MQMRTGTASSGDLDIYYEDMGDPNDPAVLLIMGLGAQLLLWRKEFCEKLVDQGLRVIRYDNRDVGLSTKVTGRHTGAPLPPRMVRSFLGLRSPAVYTLEDMADDAAALLDHLDDRQGAHRRRLDGRHDRPGLRGPAQAPHQDAGGHLLEQQPAAAAAAGAQAAAGDPAEAQGLDARGDHRERDPRHQDHRQPGLSGARGAHPRRGHRGLRPLLLPRRHRPPFRRDPRQRQPAAATTGRSTSRPW